MRYALGSLLFAGASRPVVWRCAGRCARADFFGLKGQRPLAVKNACADKQRSPNCVGENISPPLAWSGAPEGTKSFAIVMLDPEGRAPAGVVHMVIYGIPGDVKGFAEGELSRRRRNLSAARARWERTPIGGRAHHQTPTAPLHLHPDRRPISSRKIQR